MKSIDFIDKASYKGVVLEDFDLGTLLDRKDLGKSMNIDVDGKGFTENI
jgi:hypothetical protein